MIRKLSDVVPIYGNKLTKTGKQRKKGGRQWVEEFEEYLRNEWQWKEMGGGFLQSPNSDKLIVCAYAGGLEFCIEDITNVEFRQESADDILVDEENGLIILGGIVAVKL